MTSTDELVKRLEANAASRMAGTAVPSSPRKPLRIPERPATKTVDDRNRVTRAWAITLPTVGEAMKRYDRPANVELAEIELPVHRSYLFAGVVVQVGNELYATLNFELINNGIPYERRYRFYLAGSHRGMWKVTQETLHRIARANDYPDRSDRERWCSDRNWQVFDKLNRLYKEMIQ